MLQQTVTVTNPAGIHLGPAGVLCKEAVNYKCGIHFRHNNMEGNAKSVLSVLGASIRFGDELTFICDGEDEKEALERIVRLAEEGFGE